MPAYDAKECARLREKVRQWDYGSSMAIFPIDDARALADQLLAASQEIERLTQDISVIERDRENLCDEIERLRKLVGEACEIGGRYIFAPDLSPGSPRHEIRESWSLSVIDTTKPHRDKDRLAAIRREAGAAEVSK